MNKCIKIILSALLVVLTFCSNIGSTSAQGITLKDGEYSISFSFLYNGKPTTTLDNYVTTPAALFVEDGNQYIQLTLTRASVIKAFQVNGSNPDIISEDDETQTRVIKFPISDLTDLADVVVSVEAGPYKHDYEMQMKFDTTSITAVNVPDDEVEEPSADVTLADGEYTVSINTLRTDSDETYGMMDYFENPVTLKVENGKQYVYLKIVKNSSLIPYVEYVQNGSYVTMEEVGDANTRIVKYEVSDIAQPTTTKVHVSAGPYQSAYEFRIVADTTTIKEVTAPDDTVTDDGATDEDVTEDETPDTEVPGDEEPADEEVKDETPTGLSDGVYSLPFSFLTTDGKTTDKMDNYIISPATLTVKDGKNYVAVTVLNTDVVTGFKVAQNGQLTNPTVLSENASENTKIVQFEVEDLTKLLQTSVEVNVAALNYYHEYSLQIQFGEPSLLTAGETPKTESTTNDTNTVVDSEDEQVSEEEMIDTSALEFDRNGDEKSASATNEQVTNAKTFDRAQLSIYLTLLVGSLLLLIQRYRTRSI